MLRKRKKNQSNDGGFTLVELLVAIFIFSFAILGLMQVFIQGNALTDMSGKKTLALAEAQGVLEEIRSHDYDLITTDYGVSGSPGNLFNLASLDGSGQISVSQFSETSDPDLLHVLINVTWVDSSDRRFNDSLEGLVAAR